MNHPSNPRGRAAACLLSRLLLGALVTAPLPAAMLRVPGDFPTVQAACDASQPGDTVRLARGSYPENLVAPLHDLLLCSDYPFEGDSSAIDETILDGRHLGPVLTTAGTGSQHLSLNGLTVYRGAFIEGSWGAGGVELQLDNAFSARNCVFRDNRARNIGTAILGVRWGTSRLGPQILDNCRLHLDSDPDGLPSGFPQVYMYRVPRVDLRRLRFVSGVHPTPVLFMGGDTIIARDILLQGLHYGDEPTVTGLLGLTVESDTVPSLLDVDSLTIRDCSAQGKLLQLNSSSSLHPYGRAYVRRLTIEDCRNTIPPGIEEWNAGLQWIGGDSLVAEDLVYRRNSSLATGLLNGLGARHSGVVRRLTVEDNVSGIDSSLAINTSWRNRLLKIGNCSVEDALLQRNTVNLQQMSFYHYYSWASGGVALAISVNQLQAHDYFMRRIVVRDHLVNDPDDYSDWRVDPIGSRGHALGITSDRNHISEVKIEDVLVEHIRYPNRAPEQLWEYYSPIHPVEPMEPGDNMIGSAVALSFSPRPQPNVRFVVRNMLIRDCDDGGFFQGPLYPASRSTTIENLAVINVDRAGCTFGGDTLRAANILVQGVHRWGDNLPPGLPSNQLAVGALSRVSGEVRNLSVIDVDLPILFDGRPAGQAQTTIVNSLVADAVYDHFSRPPISYPSWPYREFDPPEVRWSLLPEATPGDGNFVWTGEVGFDPVLGPPWLAPSSLAVDAGDPATAYEDREDPAHPGWALWPSQGTVRADLGYTGGPTAGAQIDTSWVAVLPPPPGPARPGSLRLGAPYPNPFNPLLRIPWELDAPAAAELTVHDLLGREVATLFRGRMGPGRHEALFDGSRLASGVYLIRLRSGAQLETRKALLLK
jgi:hypothetical protein